MLTVKLEIIDFRAPGSQAHALYGTKWFILNIDKKTKIDDLKIVFTIILV